MIQMPELPGQNATLFLFLFSVFLDAPESMFTVTFYILWVSACFNAINRVSEGWHS